MCKGGIGLWWMRRVSVRRRVDETGVGIGNRRGNRRSRVRLIRGRVRWTR